MGLNRRTFVHRVATLAAVAGTTGMALNHPAHAAKATTVTVASLLGDDKPETRIWHRFAELVQQRLPGAFRFNIVKNAALGGEREVAEAIRLGAVQASLSTVSALSAWVPEAQVLDLPFLFQDAAHVQRATEGAPGQRLQQRFASQQFVVLAYINYGARHLLTKTPITTPDGLRGLRFRSIQSALHTQLWSAYGAIPTGIPIPETYNALANGVVEAMDLTQSAYAGFRLYEVVPCLTETAHIWATGVVYFSQSFWSRLSPEQQAVFQAAAREAAQTFNTLMQADEAASMQIAQVAGARVLPAQNRPAWEAGAHAVWEQMADAVGGEAAIADIRALATAGG